MYEKKIMFIIVISPIVLRFKICIGEVAFVKSPVYPENQTPKRLRAGIFNHFRVALILTVKTYQSELAGRLPSTEWWFYYGWGGGGRLIIVNDRPYIEIVILKLWLVAFLDLVLEEIIKVLGNLQINQLKNTRRI